MQPTVLVIGAGTAGTAASIFLRQKGVAVVLAERSAVPGPTALPKIGESLPPDGRTLLEELDVLEQFERGPHLPCHGNKSYWHSSTPQYHDFLQHPAGHGWHLDRLTFDRMLLDKAIELGGTDEGPPGERMDNFYAGYFRDLDGNKLNAFCFG